MLGLLIASESNPVCRGACKFIQQRGMVCINELNSKTGEEGPQPFLISSSFLQMQHLVLRLPQWAGNQGLSMSPTQEPEACTDSTLLCTTKIKLQLYRTGGEDNQHPLNKQDMMLTKTRDIVPQRKHCCLLANGWFIQASLNFATAIINFLLRDLKFQLLSCENTVMSRKQVLNYYRTSQLSELFANETEKSL